VRNRRSSLLRSALSSVVKKSLPPRGYASLVRRGSRRVRNAPHHRWTGDEDHFIKRVNAICCRSVAQLHTLTAPAAAASNRPSSTTHSLQATIGVNCTTLIVAVHCRFAQECLQPLTLLRNCRQRSPSTPAMRNIASLVSIGTLRGGLGRTGPLQMQTNKIPLSCPTPIGSHNGVLPNGGDSA
jgi:hypothetical protein